MKVCQGQLNSLYCDITSKCPFEFFKIIKLHFLKKIIKRNSQSHTIDFQKIAQQKHVYFYGSTCSLGELNEKPNHIKLSKS